MAVSSSNMREFTLKAVIVFVVVTLGIVAGISISVKTGLTTKLTASSSGRFELPNRTSLKTGESLPTFEVVDQDGQPIQGGHLVSGKKTLVAIVSNGCKPCHWLVEHLAEMTDQDDFGYSVLLLSIDPEFFAENFPFPAYRVKQESLDEYDIGVMPTILVLNEDAVIQSVNSGFSRESLQKLLNHE